MKLYEEVGGNKCSVFMAVINSVGRVIARHIHAGEPVSGTDAGIELRVWRRKGGQLTAPQVQKLAEAINEARDRALRSLGVNPGIKPGTVAHVTWTVPPCGSHKRERQHTTVMLVIRHENGELEGNTLGWLEGVEADGCTDTGQYMLDRKSVV